MEGRLGPLLEALSELQDVLLLVQQRVGASVHFSLRLGTISINKNNDINFQIYFKCSAEPDLIWELWRDSWKGSTTEQS